MMLHCIVFSRNMLFGMLLSRSVLYAKASPKTARHCSITPRLCRGEYWNFISRKSLRVAADWLVAEKAA
jgi:hypothetical protein